MLVPALEVSPDARQKLKQILSRNTCFHITSQKISTDTSQESQRKRASHSQKSLIMHGTKVL